MSQELLDYIDNISQERYETIFEKLDNEKVAGKLAKIIDSWEIIESTSVENNKVIIKTNNEDVMTELSENDNCVVRIISPFEMQTILKIINRFVFYYFKNINTQHDRNSKSSPYISTKIDKESFFIIALTKPDNYVDYLAIPLWLFESFFNKEIKRPDYVLDLLTKNQMFLVTKNKKGQWKKYD
jgi:hypothetical protein